MGQLLSTLGHNCTSVNDNIMTQSKNDCDTHVEWKKVYSRVSQLPRLSRRMLFIFLVLCFGIKTTYPKFRENLSTNEGAPAILKFTVNLGDSPHKTYYIARFIAN